MGETEQMTGIVTTASIAGGTEKTPQNQQNFGKLIENDLKDGRNLLLKSKIPKESNDDKTSERVSRDIKCQQSSQCTNFVTKTPQLEKYFKLSDQIKKEIDQVIVKYPMKQSTHILNLIKNIDGPIGKQFIPSIKELTEDSESMLDSLNEEGQKPIPDVPLVHRYENKVLLFVSNVCAANCRACTRKRAIDKIEKIKMETIMKGVSYINKTKSINDVVVSGGDPFMLDVDEIDFILKTLISINHVETIRIGTRTPSTYPEAINDDLLKVLSKYVKKTREESKVLMIGVHFDHPAELTQESKEACFALFDVGIQLYNQSILLKGINDNPKTLAKLCLGLRKINVQPQYIYQCDPVEGTKHFRTKITDGINIMRKLRKLIPGPAIPIYVVDLPGGFKKVPVDLGYYINTHEPSNVTYFRDNEGIMRRYPIPFVNDDKDKK